MYGMNTKTDPLSDPRIAALMASVESQVQDEDDSELKDTSIPHPPETFNEFLQREKIDEWPQRLTMENFLDLRELHADLWTVDDITGVLKESSPLGMDILSDLGRKLDQYSDKLNAFADFIVSNEKLPSRFKENLFHAPTKEELEKAADSDAVALHHSRKKKKNTKQSMAEAMQASKSKNIDYVSFPGFRQNELTELPSQLEAPQLLNKVTEAQTFNKGFAQLWKKIFLSEASIAMLQDTFWWFFLENFEHNPTAQDKLYTRIADSYVSLFMSINPDIRDKFFQVFPRCFAQCVYLTFREAFPESADRITEEFVTEISSTTCEWICGIKPPVSDWKNWPWCKLCSPPGEIKSQNLPQADTETTLDIDEVTNYIKNLNYEAEPVVPAITFTTDSLTPSSDGRDATSASFKTKINTEDGDSSFLKEEKPATPLAKKLTVQKELIIESAISGPGPDFERVLFNLGGRSPLVAHYLHMKQLRSKTLVGKRMKRTEVLQQFSIMTVFFDCCLITPPALTFQEIIRHSKKTIRDLHARRERMTVAMLEESAKQEKIRRNLMVQTRRMQQALTDPIEIKMRSDRVLDQALGGGLHRPSSYDRIKSPNVKEEELLENDLDSVSNPTETI